MTDQREPTPVGTRTLPGVWTSCGQLRRVADLPYDRSATGSRCLVSGNYGDGRVPSRLETLLKSMTRISMTSKINKSIASPKTTPRMISKMSCFTKAS